MRFATRPREFSIRVRRCRSYALRRSTRCAAAARTTIAMASTTPFKSNRIILPRSAPSDVACAAPAATRPRYSQVEVENLEQLRAALETSVDRIMSIISRSRSCAKPSRSATPMANAKSSRPRETSISRTCARWPKPASIGYRPAQARAGDGLFDALRSVTLKRFRESGLVPHEHHR